MRVLILKAPEDPLVLEEALLPQPAPTEVRVRV